jgi:2'-5' RNA ligase
VRLFIALDLPYSVRHSIRALITRLRPESTGARWVRPEGVHITLKFLGETGERKLDLLQPALETIQSPQPVEMYFRGLGFFPNEFHPQVVWCGVDASPNLVQLAKDVERTLESLGWEPEGRPFVPHLTLARFKSHDGLDKLVRAANNLKSYDFGHTFESEFHLFESMLKPSGAEYKKLATFRFVKGGT